MWSCRTGRRWRRRSARHGICPIGAVEADQRGRGAGVDWRGDRAGILDLEHRAVAVRAALGSCRTGCRWRRRSAQRSGSAPVGAVEAEQGCKLNGQNSISSRLCEGGRISGDRRLAFASQSSAKSCQVYEREPEHDGGDAAAGSADSHRLCSKRSAGGASQTQHRDRAVVASSWSVGTRTCAGGG